MQESILFFKLFSGFFFFILFFCGNSMKSSPFLLFSFPFMGGFILFYYMFIMIAMISMIDINIPYGSGFSTFSRFYFFSHLNTLFWFRVHCVKNSLIIYMPGKP